MRLLKTVVEKGVLSAAIGMLALSGNAGAVNWGTIDFGAEGGLSARTRSTDLYESRQEPEAVATLFNRKTNVGPIRGEATDVYYYADLFTGELGAFSSSMSAYCPEEECIGHPNWSVYDARSSGWVRMKDTLTFTVAAGSYPAGVDVAINGYASGYIGSQGDNTSSAASARYHVHFSNIGGPGGQNIDSGCLRVEAGEAMPIYQPYSVGFTLVQPGTEVAELFTSQTLAEFGLGIGCPVATQGKSALQQGIGNAWMIPGIRIESVTASDERVEWSSASGVFLNHVPDDADGDNVPDSVDNCTLLWNQDQRDSNEDGLGNACDADLDGDCSVNFGDLAALKAAFYPRPYNPDADFNGDALVNFGDLATMKATFFNGPNPGPGPSGLPNDCD